MNPALKSKLPLLFLLMISVAWGTYYSSKTVLNDFGQANFEWLFLVDGLIVLPLLCWFSESDKKKATSKALILMLIAVVVGSYIIPEPNKNVWHVLEFGRYVVLGIVLLIEVFTIATVYMAVRHALVNGQDPDEAIAQPVQRKFGTTLFSSLLCFETRMWTFALFSSRIRKRDYRGQQHFSYHQKDGANTHLLGFMLIMLLELPIMHMLLHFLWSPSAANIVTLLTAFGLVFFYAELKAVALRPISIDHRELIIRVGIYQPLYVPLSMIKRIEENHKFISRDKGIKRCNYAGVPNVRIELTEPVKGIHTLYLGLDTPNSFIAAVEQSIQPANDN